jgi:RluA family pseudouridine synthase
MICAFSANLPVRFDVLKWTVTHAESGSKLLAFIKSKMGDDHSARYLKRAIESNLCQINGRTERFASSVIGEDDIVTLALEELVTSKPFVVESSRILYEDADLFAYNKPAGYSSEGQDLLQAMKKHNPSLILLHRLDRDTTGVLLFAKNASTQAAILALFKKHWIHKEYLALVDGVPEQNSGTIDNFLGKVHVYEGQAIWGEVSSRQGLHAVTVWQCEQKGANAALLRCFPKTGRTHQIRVHLSSLGHPILGDYQYGRHFSCTYHPLHHLLHAVEIHFTHPSTGEKVEIKAPLSEEFSQALKALIRNPS